MSSQYWKRYDNDYYSFDKAINKWEQLYKEHKNPIIRCIKNENGSIINLDNQNIPEDINDIKLPLWAINSDKWTILIPDIDKNEKVEEIKDWIMNDLNFELDTRFYNADKMDLSDWWNRLDEQLISEDVAYEIMLWLKDNKILGKKSKNLIYSRLNK